MISREIQIPLPSFHSHILRAERGDRESEKERERDARGKEGWLGGKGKGLCKKQKQGNQTKPPNLIDKDDSEVITRGKRQGR